MYFNYINDTPYDVINYENVCSDYLLLWGNYSKNEISKLIPNSSNYIVFGYPKSKFPILSKQIKSERIFVILPRDIYLDDSIKLLNFLKDYKIQFTIRPHPSISTKINDIIKSNDNFIIDSAMLLSESLNKHKYRAIISFNSTAIFEAALYEQNVYLFKTNKNEFKNPGFNELTLESDLIIELGKGKLIQKDSFFSEKINLEKDK
ncbi:hypothetical protein [Psychromonas sp. KJ10-2]|uniref:hypothetical protein n=1 Tax=Psychromonas sp. KJ10-2 TaxID=3391822 RepID=UPI0039B6E2A6